MEEDMNKVWGHFKTITKHRHKVIEHCLKAGILWQGLGHDLSKYSPAEFIVGTRFYTGDKSPNEGERAAYGYSKAWMHHKGRNKHHFEYWTDYDPVTKKMIPIKMPVEYVKEMFCDRIAASKIYMKEKYSNKAPLEYFRSRTNHELIHSETATCLENLLMMLAEQGEEKTFEVIKKMKNY